MDKPNLIKKAGNFIQASARHAASGFSTVSPEIAQQRMDICKTCEHFQMSDRTCKICGCYLDIKTTWKSEACPIKKWLAIETKKSGSFTKLPETVMRTPDSYVNPSIDILVRPCNCGSNLLPEDPFKETS